MAYSDPTAYALAVIEADYGPDAAEWTRGIIARFADAPFVQKAALGMGLGLIDPLFTLAARLASDYERKMITCQVLTAVDWPALCTALDNYSGTIDGLITRLKAGDVGIQAGRVVVHPHRPALSAQEARAVFDELRRAALGE
jgi:hypothetical protein